MNNREEEEEQYPIQQRVGQEEPAPKPIVQVLLVFAFIGFIAGLPAIIERLGK